MQSPQLQSALSKLVLEPATAATGICVGASLAAIGMANQREELRENDGFLERVEKRLKGSEF